MRELRDLHVLLSTANSSTQGSYSITCRRGSLGLSRGHAFERSLATLEVCVIGRGGEITLVGVFAPPVVM